MNDTLLKSPTMVMRSPQDMLVTLSAILCLHIIRCEQSITNYINGVFGLSCDNLTRFLGDCLVHMSSPKV